MGTPKSEKRYYADIIQYYEELTAYMRELGYHPKDDEIAALKAKIDRMSGILPEDTIELLELQRTQIATLRKRIEELTVQKEWMRAVWEASEFSALDEGFEEQWTSALEKTDGTN